MAAIQNADDDAPQALGGDSGSEGEPAAGGDGDSGGSGDEDGGGGSAGDGSGS